MTDALPRDVVAERIDAIEAEHAVRVVLAVESGSRAWGFASADSDYDVRFLYVHRPAWYLAIDRRRDVIERPIVDDIDLAGWNLRKALGLFFKSNPPLYEWLRSPLVYRETTAIAEGLRQRAAAFYDPKAGFYHYLHMAESNARAELRKDQIRHKKYFYVLRPILACRWIEAGDGTPPMEFAALADRHLPAGDVRHELDRLLVQKRGGTEADAGPRLPALHAFIDAELARLAEAARGIPKPHREIEPLNTFFLDALYDAWPTDPAWRSGRSAGGAA